MTSRDSPTGSQVRGSSRGAQIFVGIAVSLVATAVGCAAYAHLGANINVAAGLAAATFILLMAVHAICSTVLASVGRAAETHSSLTESRAAVSSSAAVHGARPPNAGLQGSLGSESAPGHLRAQTAGRNSPPDMAGGSRISPAVHRVANEPSEDDLGHAALREFWTFRPSDPVFEVGGSSQEPSRPLDVKPSEPVQHPAHAPPRYPGQSPQRRLSDDRQTVTPAPAPDPAQSADAPPAALREADVEMIQGLIKKLADQVNASNAAAADSEPAGAPRRPAQRNAPQQRGFGELPPAPPAAGVERSLEALRVTADTMREAAVRKQYHAPVAAAPPAAPPDFRDPVRGPAENQALAPPPVRHGHVQIAAIADCVHAGRFDVMLEPIMGLGTLRASHYEVSLRLLDAAGATLQVDRQDPRLAGANLLPLLDRTRLERAAAVAGRLAERGKPGSIFSDMSGEALTDNRFMVTAAESGERIRHAGQLVLTFAQNDLRLASDAQLGSLGDLRSMGFCFALAGVTDLDMDFETLVAAGFAFVKLDADVFLEGLRAAHGVIPARDICGYLAGLGLTLVVDRIDSEYERSRLQTLGVMLGQGSLFGGPRPMKADALAGARSAAA